MELATAITIILLRYGENGDQSLDLSVYNDYMSTLMDDANQEVVVDEEDEEAAAAECKF